MAIATQDPMARSYIEYQFLSCRNMLMILAAAKQIDQSVGLILYS
jgi:hypothetical protein